MNPVVYLDDEFSKRLTAILMFIILILGIFFLLSSQISSNILTYILVSAGLVLIAGFARNVLVHGMFFGSKKAFYLSLGVGLVLGTALGLGSRSTAASVLNLDQITNLNFFLVNILAPFVEPLLFRGVIFPTITMLAFWFLKKSSFGGNGLLVSTLISFIITSYLFGLIHVFVYFNVANVFDARILPLAILGAVFIIGTLIFKSIGFEYGFHFMLNLFAVSAYSVTQIISTTVLVMFILILISEAVSRTVKK